MKMTEMNMMKFRSWQLASGEWLILLFLRTADGRLQLLSEEYAPNEDGVKEAITVAQERLRAAVKSAGATDCKVTAQFPGAKKA